MANPSSENRITCQLCYGQNGEHQKGCAMNQRSIPPSSNQQLNGTFECPVCGKDSPHQHAANTIRWYSDHLDRFMLAVNGGEPKESFDWGGTYPNPERPDEPPRFRHQPYQSLWESYCCFVRAGLIPARLAVETPARCIHDRVVCEPCAQMAIRSHEKTIALVKEIHDRHRRINKLLYGGQPWVILGPMDSDAAHADRGALLSMLTPLQRGAVETAACHSVFDMAHEVIKELHRQDMKGMRAECDGAFLRIAPLDEEWPPAMETPNGR